MNWNQSDALGRQGVAFVELTVSRLGHQFREQPKNDVGIDAHVELVDSAARKATGQLVALQIKAGPSFFNERSESDVTYRGDQKHLDYWLNHSLPVFLVLVDAEQQKAYWKEINDTTVERLSKGWKVAVPFSNELPTNFINAARHRVGIDPAAARYTRLKLDDSSNGMTKRYRAQVLVRHPVTRLRLEAVVRRATEETKMERFQRTPALEERFRDRDAEVVGLSVAADPADAVNANWLCRTQWVSPTLEAERRPLPIGGESLGDGIEVIWNRNYGETDQFLKSLEVDKQSFLVNVQRLLAATEQLVALTFSGSGGLVVNKPTALEHAAAMRQLYLNSNNVGRAPYECRDVADRFGDVMALADNAFMKCDQLNGDAKLETASAVVLENELREYRLNVDRLRYEIEKVK
jgi:hypothetical protein